MGADVRQVEYLEARDPGVRGLAAKISPALVRPSLADQTVLWRAVMEEETIRCIYTGTVLAPRQIVVGHFVPRAFVSHDRMWNLTPTTPAINSAKSDHLPDLCFVLALADQHARLALADQHAGWRTPPPASRAFRP